MMRSAQLFVQMNRGAQLSERPLVVSSQERTEVQHPPAASVHRSRQHGDVERAQRLSHGHCRRGRCSHFRHSRCLKRFLPLLSCQRAQQAAWVVASGEEPYCFPGLPIFRMKETGLSSLGSVIRHHRQSNLLLGGSSPLRRTANAVMISLIRHAGIWTSDLTRSRRGGGVPLI